MSLDGFVVLDKPLGLGSTQAVAAIKRIARQTGAGKVKVGHGGTLDPLATGVLPIALGEATKVAGRLLDATKIYDFTLRFGEATSTLDAEGEVVATSDARPTRAELLAVLPRFTGPIEQVPPAFSALKVDGRRAYELARAGEEVVLESRAVVVHEMALQRASAALLRKQEPSAGSWQAAGQDEGGNGLLLPQEHGEEEERRLDQAHLSATVSKGTYIRTLGADIAAALGTVGHLTALKRTRAGPFAIDQALTLDEVEERARAGGLGSLLRPVASALADIPALRVSRDQADRLAHGRVWSDPARTGLHLALDGDRPVALVEFDGGELRIVRGFNPPR